MSVLSQSTIASKISLSGVGIHTGKKANMVILPAAPNSGIIFKRTDLKENNLIKANFQNVSSAKLCTTLENKNGAKVSTVEHLLAALYISGIDNAIIEINADEVPIMDGSSSNFVFLLVSAGIVEQDKPKKFIKINFGLFLMKTIVQ